MSNLQILFNVILGLLSLLIITCFLIWYKGFKPFRWDYKNGVIDLSSFSTVEMGVHGSKSCYIWILLKGDIIPWLAKIERVEHKNLISNSKHRKLIITCNNKIIDFDNIVKWKPKDTWKNFYWYYCV